MDYLRPSCIANCEFSTMRFTLTSDFLRADVNLAISYGATFIDEDTVQHPNKGNHFSNHS